MELAAPALDTLECNPDASITGSLNGTCFSAEIAIPEYGRRIHQHFGRHPDGLPMDFPFRHFGLSITFDTPVELAVHDADRRLNSNLRALLDRFGPLTFKNAFLPNNTRQSEQRNVFSSLDFHIDRGRTQDDNISLFWRDPFDPIQRAPRSSQTLVLANAAAYLQAVKEGRGEHTFEQHYALFKDEDIAHLIGDVVLELGWRAPEGVGEIALVDNHRMLHASYYAHSWNKGYPISVRYIF
ncbi:MAG: hypothetical protein GKS00_28510 [Alphaproteobacteria bacterium]|nr:hypothetical protein [Alphaproteobacteria bacterium]